MYFLISSNALVYSYICFAKLGYVVIYGVHASFKCDVILMVLGFYRIFLGFSTYGSEARSGIFL